MTFQQRGYMYLKPIIIVAYIDDSVFVYHFHKTIDGFLHKIEYVNQHGPNLSKFPPSGRQHGWKQI